MKRAFLVLPMMGALLVSGCAYEGPVVTAPYAAPVYGPPAPSHSVLWHMRMERERAAREEAARAEMRHEHWRGMEARRQHRLWCESRGFRPAECR